MRSYTVGGVPLSVERGSFNLSDRLNERTVASFRVVDPALAIEPGMDVVIRDQGVVIFAGVVDVVEVSGEEVLAASVKCVDYSRLLDKRLVYDTFEDEPAGAVVASLVNGFFAEEGISLGTIEDGPVIARAVFDYPDGTTAMNWIRDLAQLNWFVDQDKRLHLHDRASYAAPFALGDDSLNFHKLRVSRTKAQYRNRQFVRGGKGRSGLIELERPSPRPDGTSRTFILRLPLAEKPAIVIDGTPVDPADVGLAGQDTGLKWYYAPGTNTITHDSSQPALLDEVLEVSYRGFYPIMVVTDNADEIALRQQLEGGSGLYEWVDHDETLDSRQAALQFGHGLLVRYGQITRVVGFDTHVPGLVSGHLMTIQNSRLDLDGQFLVESVTARDVGGVTRYEVKALDGEALGGWEEFFKGIIRGQQRLVIRENEVLVIQLAFRSRAALFSAAEVSAHDYLAAGQHLRVGAFRI